VKKLFAILLFAIPAFAAVPPDLTELARQIEHVPAEGNDSARLKRFFDLYWAARLREMPDLAIYVGDTSVEARLPDFSPEMLALTHRLSHL